MQRQLIYAWASSCEYDDAHAYGYGDAIVDNHKTSMVDTRCPMLLSIAYAYVNANDSYYDSTEFGYDSEHSP